MENKKSLSTLLFGIALLLFVCATFAMFGPVVVHNGGSTILPNMFEAAFGTSTALGVRTPGITAIFVFQMIIIIDAIAIVVGTATRKFHYILTIVLYGVLCLCAFITFIISFNAGRLYLAASSRGATNEYSLGVGPIIYSIMHILGLVSSVAGLVLSRRGA